MDRDRSPVWRYRVRVDCHALAQRRGIEQHALAATFEHDEFRLLRAGIESSGEVARARAPGIEVAHARSVGLAHRIDETAATGCGAELRASMLARFFHPLFPVTGAVGVLHPSIGILDGDAEFVLLNWHGGGRRRAIVERQGWN